MLSHKFHIHFCLAILFIIVNSSLSFARIGLAEISFTTPGGHTICHCDPYNDEEVPVLIGWDKLHQLETWYFYHDAIVGKGNGYYFIFQEDVKNLQIYDNEEKWQLTIDQWHLRPFYTRWMDLGDSPDNFLFMLYMTSIVSVPLILLLFIVIIILSIKKQIIWNKKTIVISAGIIGLIALFLFSKFYVNSF
ncbi:MAG: hypothetical protein JWM14_1772 [Chitinophagaceae bacterium]|nr:hypothetical protein [Chitinophagaceae bacterium]